MKKNLPVMIGMLLMLSALGFVYTVATPETAAQDNFDQTLISKSKEVWEAYKTRNVGAMKALSSPDYVSFSQAGPSTIAQDIATIDKLSIESYSLDDPKVLRVTKDVAILRYKCALKGSFEGRAFTPVYATEVWVNRGGKWQIISYSETTVS